MDNFASWGGGIRGLFLATLTSFNFPGGASLTRLGPHMYSLYMGTKRSCNLEYLIPEIITFILENNVLQFSCFCSWVAYLCHDVAFSLYFGGLEVRWFVNSIFAPSLK